MGKKFTVSILGCGSRGHYTYGACMFPEKDKFEIVSVCDCNPKQIALAQSAWGLTDEQCFLSDEEFLKEKRSAFTKKIKEQCYG